MLRADVLCYNASDVIIFILVYGPPNSDNYVW